MKKYQRLSESKMKYIAYRDVVNNRYSSVKPFREYLILTDDSTSHENGSMICFDNVKVYTKEMYKNKKISNKMILIDVRNTCIDKKRDNWIFENGEIEIK